MMSDDECLTALRNSDMQGMRLLFDRYYGLLSRTAYYITKDKSAAEDLAQDVFLRLWDSRNKLNHVINPKAYLITSTKNSALNYLKRDKRYERDQLDLALKATYEWEYEDGESLELMKQKVQNIVSSLPPKCRMIFSMSRFEGLSNEEIATYLDLSKRTVEAQISIALKVFREELGEQRDGTLYSFWALALCFGVAGL